MAFDISKYVDSYYDDTGELIIIITINGVTEVFYTLEEAIRYLKKMYFILSDKALIECILKELPDYIDNIMSSAETYKPSYPRM